MDELKILFVDTNRRSIKVDDTILSLGFISLGSHVKAEVSCEVKIFRLQDIRTKYEVDGKDEIAIFISKVIDEKPDVVCFSTYYMAQFFTLELAKRIKEKAEALVIFGGYNPTDIDEHMLQSFDFVDLIFRGEAERTFVQFCKELSDLKKTGQKIERESVISSCTLAGVSYLDQEGQFKSNEHPGFISDLDTLKFMDPELFLVYPRIKTSKSMFMEYSRGCPFQCTFCSTSLYWGRNCRKKSTGRLIDEVRYYHEKLGIDELEFADDGFFTDPKLGVDVISKIYDLGFIKKIAMCTRITSLNKEIVDQLNKFENIRLFFGIESASPSVLKDMRKGLTLEWTRENLKLFTGRDNFVLTFGFIMGYPTETDDDLNQTMEFILELKRILHDKAEIIISHMEYGVNTPITNRYQKNLVQFAEYPFEDYISSELREKVHDPLFFSDFLCPDFRLDRQDKEFFYLLLFSHIAECSDTCRFFESVISALEKKPIELLSELYEYTKHNYDIDFIIEDCKFRTSKELESRDEITDLVFFFFIKFLDEIYSEIGTKIPDDLKSALKHLRPSQYFLLFKHLQEKKDNNFMGIAVRPSVDVLEADSQVLCDEIHSDDLQQRLEFLENLSSQDKSKFLLSFFTVNYPDGQSYLFYFTPGLEKLGYFEKAIEKVFVGEEIPERPDRETIKDIREDIDSQMILKRKSL